MTSRFPNLPTLLKNMRDAYVPAEKTRLDADQEYTEKGPLATDPTEAPGNTPHVVEDKQQQEVRLALAPLYDAIEHMTAVGAVIGQAMENIRAIYNAPLYAPTQVNGTPYIVKDNKRNHVAILVYAAQTITVNVPGMGYGTYNLSIGWNQVDFPPLTEITTTGAAFNALVYYSQDRIANA